MKTKICNICKLGIDMDKEFCEFKHYSAKDVLKSKGYYHVTCFRDKMNGGRVNEMVARKAMEVLDKIGMKAA